MERTLYNGVISGMSVDGGRFFYPNPLSSDGKYKFNADGTVERQPWFGCACCPSNLCRFIPSFPGYMYAVKDNRLYVNLFAGSTVTTQIGGKNVTLTQETSYPWDGDVTIRIDNNKAKVFDMAIRIPGWVDKSPVPSNLYRYADDVIGGYSVKVNGQEVAATTEKGYLTISRQWKKGDVVTIHFDMPVRAVKASERVTDDRGRIAVVRGPLVYCAEGADNQRFNIFNFLMPSQPRFRTAEHTINGNRDVTFSVTAVEVDGESLELDKQGHAHPRPAVLTMIPYYAWNHRGPGNMEVWMPQSISALGNY
jgi:DUF1680 family protein